MNRTLGGFVGYSGPVLVWLHDCAEMTESLESIEQGCGKTGLTIRELYVNLEEAAFPDGLVFAGNAAVPRLEIEDAGLALLRFGEEAEGVVFAPLLPVVD